MTKRLTSTFGVEGLFDEDARRPPLEEARGSESDVKSDATPEWSSSSSSLPLALPLTLPPSSSPFPPVACGDVMSVALI